MYVSDLKQSNLMSFTLRKDLNQSLKKENTAQ